MKTRFIDFEGIHGTGKSTTAWILQDSLEKNGYSTESSFEANMDDPRRGNLDFSFMSALTLTEIDELKHEFPQQRELIEELYVKIDGYYLIYYPYLREHTCLHEKLSQYEVYGGRLPIDIFMNLTKRLFKSFVEQALCGDSIYIYESVIFQQVINEVLRFWLQSSRARKNNLKENNAKKRNNKYENSIQAR